MSEGVYLGMNVAGWFFLFTLMCLSGMAVIIYLWGKRSGQFKEVEGVKYRMMDEEKKDI
ncbi:cbb3-type cytochrome oxidase assembly protein CcoS [Alteribacter aurantiacus]|uniref:cbb3-type cytochrome oxidase assembly protein CcoS n=1 Tax=Alteribacter aurantiacus TaxID=254410 RepID=UPI00041BAD42|nr:cbb3-type cytochrome oxidase assembly protein CcoS [Alteribacter aurantiacus]